MTHRLSPLLNPRSVAMVGASPKPGTVQRSMVEMVRTSRLDGPLFAVNPNYTDVEGIACYPSLRALPEPPDLAVLGVGAARMETALEDAIAGGARSVMIFDNCYLEMETRPRLLELLQSRAREADLPVCGGNGMGYCNFEKDIFIGFWQPRERPAGHIALVAHSGSVFADLIGNDPRFRFNLAVSAGQEINATVADYMDYVLELPSTRVIALFLETVRDPPGFVAALGKARQHDIPVLITKVGRTEESGRLAETHTGALVGSDTAFDAVLDAHGAVRVRTTDELLAAALLLELPERPPAGGLVVMTDSGGYCESIVDLAADIGVPIATLATDTLKVLSAHLPAYMPATNPIDIGIPLRTERSQMVIEMWATLMDDPNTAIGAFEFNVADDFAYMPKLIDAAERLAETSPKPFVIFSSFSRVTNNRLAARYADVGLPLINGVDNLLAAVKASFTHRDHSEHRAVEVPLGLADTVARWRKRLNRAEVLDEEESLRLLADFDIPVVASKVAGSRDEAVTAAQTLRYPVALKTAMPGRTHKSDVDGVRLALGGADEVGSAYADIAGRLGPRVTIARMADAGVELVFGSVCDPQFGPVVMVGMGGQLVELIGDSVFALAPVDEAGAKRLIERLKGRPLLDGVRGAPPADLDGLAQAFSRFSLLAASLGDSLGSLDANPVIATTAGCLAVDALAVARAGNSKSNVS